MELQHAKELRKKADNLQKQDDDKRADEIIESLAVEFDRRAQLKQYLYDWDVAGEKESVIEIVKARLLEKMFTIEEHDTNIVIRW